MTVQELIVALSFYDDDIRVGLSIGGNYYGIEKIVEDEDGEGLYITIEAE
jgi:hypothetical protein